MKSSRTDDDPRVLTAAREYLAALEAGRPADRKPYLARHPELTAALNECFDGIELAHAAGRGLRPPTEPTGPGHPLGDFKLIREVGRGGMGVVYEAVQLSLGRRVAVKVLPFAGGLDPRQLQRFQTEAHAAAQLHHSNIVPVYAVGADRGVHYYAMQLIDGRTLDAVIRELRGEDGPSPGGGSTTAFQAVPSKPTRPAATATGSTSRAGRGREAYRAAAKLCARVADALEYAHDAGVVHRDIKPANLLVDAHGTPWVTDFGLAQVQADAGLTRTGDVFGTLRYMSPEQAAGRRGVDHRADVYSLGATLYELLTLEPLFPGTDRQSLLHHIFHTEPTPPRQVDRAIPAELETIVLKAVAKHPNDRYQTAGEFAADLRRFLDDRPILARRPTAFDLARKWVRRHPSVVWATGVLLAFGVVGLAVSTAMIAREQGKTRLSLQHERERAEEAEKRFALARRAADELVRVANEELANGPQFESARRRLLQTAVAYYQELIELRAGDPTAETELASAKDKVTTLLNDLIAIQGAGPVLLLTDRDVHDDLQLTSEQREQAQGLIADLKAIRPEVFQNFHKLAAAERDKKFAEVVRDNERKAEALLTPLQMKRLRQIFIQLRGPMAFQDADVIAALKLTPEQRERIRQSGPDMLFARVLKGDGGPGFGGPFRGGPDGPRGDGPRGDGPRGGGGPGGPPGRRGVEAIVEELLTDEQRAIWRNELAGKPFQGSIRGGRGGPPQQKERP